MKKDILKKIGITLVVLVLSAMASLSYSMFRYANEETEYVISFDENVMIEKISLNSNDFSLKSFIGDKLSIDENTKLLKASEKWRSSRIK